MSELSHKHRLVVRDRINDFDFFISTEVPNELKVIVLSVFIQDDVVVTFDNVLAHLRMSQVIFRNPSCR